MALQLKHLKIIEAMYGHIMVGSNQDLVKEAGTELRAYIRDTEKTKQASLTHLTDKVAKMRADEINVDTYL